ncbi:hypothetical protein [Nocardia farcinica]|uniref:hypothetical protein n=1 Tax=Nocardia farcinica TaxID=37329 RepID=UPI0024550687|nr:hypothetical protein [Nocardia farcinica]
MAEDTEYATHHGQQSAHWIVQEGTVRVRAIVDRSGRVTELDGIPLGECFGSMDRGLWEAVLRQYELQRDARYTKSLDETRARIRRTRR